ncbi:hypothetical protein HGA91_00280 [candidate division WWE3 bacterium]|nr:hypothetical protein [candidate division WWE3 bacterium]
MPLQTDWSNVGTANLRRKVAKLIKRAEIDVDQRYLALHAMGLPQGQIPNVEKLIDAATREQLEAAATILSYLIGPAKEAGKGTTIEQDARRWWEEALAANAHNGIPQEWVNRIDLLTQLENLGYGVDQINPVVRLGKVQVYRLIVNQFKLAADRYNENLGTLVEVSRREWEAFCNAKQEDEVLVAMRACFTWIQDRSQPMPSPRQMLLFYGMLGSTI